MGPKIAGVVSHCLTGHVCFGLFIELAEAEKRCVKRYRPSIAGQGRKKIDNMIKEPQRLSPALEKIDYGPSATDYTVILYDQSEYTVSGADLVKTMTLQGAEGIGFAIPIETALDAFDLEDNS